MDMSLILNQPSLTPLKRTDEPPGREGELSNLDRYLAILEDNKKASRFVPDDAAVALDMAGFVRHRVSGGRAAFGISTARLALTLAQTAARTPTQ